MPQSASQDSHVGQSQVSDTLLLSSLGEDLSPLNLEPSSEPMQQLHQSQGICGCQQELREQPEIIVPASFKICSMLLRCFLLTSTSSCQSPAGGGHIHLTHAQDDPPLSPSSLRLAGFAPLTQGLSSEAKQKTSTLNKKTACLLHWKKKKRGKISLLCCHKSEASFTLFASTASPSGLSEQNSECNLAGWQLQIYCI